MVTNPNNGPLAVIPNSEGIRIGIVVSAWHDDITGMLLDGAREALLHHGVSLEDIFIRHVPGSFELPLAAQFFAEYTDVDAVIGLGCIIQGETRHFDFVSQGVTEGMVRVSLDYNMPVLFGVLTTETLQQAQDRAGGALGNKGYEVACAALQMVHMQFEMEQEAEDFGMEEA